MQISEEAALTAQPVEDFRIDSLVKEGDLVAQGAPVLRSRRQPEIVATAPMAARVASVDLGPGHRLSSMVFFKEAAPGRHEYDTKAAASGDAVALRASLLASGLWRFFRSRPFGKTPVPAEIPSAIFVMALDTRPAAPDPRLALHDRIGDFEHGLRALLGMTEGPVHLCQDSGDELVGPPDFPGNFRLIRNGGQHPWGLAGLQIHAHYPAAINRPVWDIHAEDVAGIGEFLRTGMVPETLTLSVTGTALREPRLVRCQPGADLRSLCYSHVKPGLHSILSGSALDGRRARWLRHRDRQVAVMVPDGAGQGGHWFLSALHRARRPLPLVPNAAVEQSLGGAFPVMPFLRALSSGDAETATKLGVLSLLTEDLALADYVTCAEPRLSDLLNGMLDRIEAEEAA
ncbi:Na(+)-translocating NADH-quinone reductase subunit A [Pseudoruegeria sp. HB172150]|uniref:Na(+)-translocating NADH-quinone reductase subunit A n=1 Tax=Pseudoruegeria sp. HB172150 TaxID=2721164 RepID=UPI001552F789|nr:Na(+)-translocating NADH-quinone reductase subunit A [Pseudoruegeria sp. HB172150]